jgi:hypothetical protein
VNPLNQRYANIVQARQAAERNRSWASGLFPSAGELALSAGIGGLGYLEGGAPGGAAGLFGSSALMRGLATTPGATGTAQLVRRSPVLARFGRNVALAQQNREKD